MAFKYSKSFQNKSDLKFGVTFIGKQCTNDAVLILMQLLAGCCLDTDGVFKAHNARDETKDAEQVNDTDETKYDVPVDLQDAEPVEVNARYNFLAVYDTVADHYRSGIMTYQLQLPFRVQRQYYNGCQLVHRVQVYGMLIMDGVLTG